MTNTASKTLNAGAETPPTAVGVDVPPPPTPPADPEPEPEDDGTLALDRYAERAYLAYAMSVVKSRALPQVEDGLKPVQRRILYAMNEMRLSSTSKHVKSARVVGDVIGKYHPHGDISVYDAMVRVAQDFSLRYPLVDGQGNFGSRDGDSAAAMRYTECRLTPIAELLLAEIDRGTVDFIPNYDGAFEEPQLLPARLPFVLLNGASGIAVGMATEIPPHNLREVAEATCHLIRHPEATLEDVLGIIPGPDFPGGGQLISTPETIREAYASGRGSLRLRARWKIEELARGQWRAIVDELPHGVSAAQVLSEIETLTNPQPRAGKKEVSQEQKNLKQLVLGVLDTVRDESSDKAPVRIVLEPKSSRQNRDEFMAVLLAHTSLETSASVNMTMIGRDGRPQQKNLVQILREWIDFRYVTVERRTRHRLDEVDRRIHILEGRMIAFLHIEEVIRVIRESDEPKPALIAAFGLSDIQAEDILEIRLRQLARLEGFKIEKELAELRDERAGLQHLLDSRAAMTKLILKEIQDDAKKYGDDRRTAGRGRGRGRAGRDLGARRARHRHRVEERLGALAPGPRHRSGGDQLQGRRLRLRGDRDPHHLAADRHRQQRPRLHGKGVRPARRARRRRADHHPGGVPGRRQAGAGGHRHARFGLLLRQQRRLRLPVQRDRRHQSPARGQGLHEPGEG